MRISLGVIPILIGLTAWAFAQEDHAAGHNDYLRWSSQKTGNCCNNQDCSGLDESQWRETATGTEVLIADTWCPVLQEHYIITGKSPDWTRAHACIRKRGYIDYLAGTLAPDPTPCDRLLCFAGVPKS